MDSLDPLRPERVIRLCQRFAVSLNHAICLALRQNPNGPSAHANYAGGTDPRHLHVISVVLVKGTPFYGYHVGHSYWLKVSLANPGRTRVAVEQLHKPVVLGRVWQPHEAHLSHVLQFMCDFDLYGCGWLDLAGGHYREPIPEGTDDDPPDWISRETIPDFMRYPDNLSPHRDTHTTFELDVLPHQILNRYRLEQRRLHHDFVELLHQPLHPEEKLVPAMRELWEDERRRRITKGLGTSEAAMLPVSGGGRGRNMQELGYKVDGVDGKNKGGDWKISEELWQILEQRMGAERARRGKLTFDQFSRALANGANGERRKYDRWIMTAFEAISAHWPKSTRTQRTQKSQWPMPSTAKPMSSHGPPTPPSEDDNPYEIIATQASQEERVEAEVDTSEVREAQPEEEEEDARQRAHAEVLRAKAKRGTEFRATQAAKRATQSGQGELDEDYTEEFELLAQHAIDEDEMPTTPSSHASTTPGKSSRRKVWDRAVQDAGYTNLRLVDQEVALTLARFWASHP